MQQNTVYKCNLCQQTFTEKKYLRSHMTRVHRHETTGSILATDNSPDFGEQFSDVHIVPVNSTSYQVPCGTTPDSSIRFDVFNFYHSFNDITAPIYSSRPKLCTEYSSLPRQIQLCVTHACRHVYSFSDSQRDYTHIIELDNCCTADGSSSLQAYFPAHHHFYNYCKSYRKLKVCEDGWVTASITLAK